VSEGSYLDRYCAGEYEQVWDDLLALGPMVFDAPLYDDAAAVVGETMRRVRFNIEHLISRLKDMGYIFGYDHRVQQLLLNPGQDRTWRDYLELREWASHQPPVFLPGPFHDEVRSEIRALGLGSVEDDVLYGIDAIPDQKGNIQRLDQNIGPIPLSIRGWYEHVGAVNLYGHYAGWLNYVHSPNYLMEQCDPLQAAVLDSALVDKFTQDQQLWPVRQFEFAPDTYFKDRRSGGSTPYTISWNEAGIDGRLLSWPDPQMTFVKYLRLSFQWAGFPGMADWAEVPEDDLAMLKQGLLLF